jgi:hypothetical protein
MLRIPHCLDNRLANGGKFVSPTLRPLSTTQKYYFPASDTNFCYSLSTPQGPVRLEGLGKETSPTANLSTRNPTLTVLGSNPGRCLGKPATNHQSYGTAC